MRNSHQGIRVGFGLYRSEIFQLGFIVLIAATSAAFLGWNARVTAKIEASRQELLRLVLSDAYELQLAVTEYSANGSDSSRDIVFGSRADLTARLDSLAGGWPAQRDRIEAAKQAANLVVEQAEETWLDKGSKASREDMREFDRLAGRMKNALFDLDAVLTEDLTVQLDRSAMLAIAALGGLTVLFVGMGSLFLTRQLRRERHWRDSVLRLDQSLETIFDPTVGIGDIDPMLGDHLVKTVAGLEKAHTDLMIAERTERHHAHFAQDLIEALEIDDTLEHVYGTVKRAAELRMRGSSFRLLVSDGSGASLEEKVSVGEKICEAPLPQRCPAIRKGRMVAFCDSAGLARCPFLKDDDTKVLCAPVASAGKAFAVSQLTWQDKAAREDLEGDLVTLTGALGTRLGVLRTLEEREQEAASDPLTGLANRRAMQHHLKQLDRSNRRYSIICFDLDHFKRLNDEHGHEVGDQCLVAFSRVLKEHSREGDLACRQGGEEFLLILSNVDSEIASEVAERVREALVDASRLVGTPFTCSMGVASRPEHGASSEGILVVADRMLYEAKESGRDRVCVASVRPSHVSHTTDAGNNEREGLELPAATPDPGEGGEPPKDEEA
ncbi:MAG: GGDEF domain-containing protein [bacterium]|nr:GGDEF domain-containing protein [bacterium]